MITEKIIDIFILIPKLCLNFLPTFEFSLPDVSIFNYFIDVLSYIAYILPLGHIITIFTLSFFITNFRVIWTIILRIKSFIPTMGG